MIRMSKLTDYAIVLLAHLARSERTLTAQALADRSRVPLPTVSKLCKELSRAHLVSSHRGRHGGYALARSAETISVAEVVEALEGPIALTECGTPLGAPCGIEPFCPAKGSWDPVSRAVHGALQKLPLSSIGPYRLAVAARDGVPATALPVVPGVT
ncbi:MAG: SUF system Fe-S cluster assembly regulator [Anaeromyxobacter sp.]|nr:SUF system Fe-S cluster assembly regulator [Anaeromyxobacter sp.]MBL0276349.1 SUF system Fe-S cluster assembly regulator [Anaeromyxobacter sp.]